MISKSAYNASVSNFEDTEATPPQDFIFICPGYLECTLAAGDAADIPELQEWCAALPMKSYGRVFIEVDSLNEVVEITAPPGIAFTWLVRRPELEARGSAMMRAVEGWLDEWLRGDPMSGRYVQLWSGARTNPEVVAHWLRIEAELAETWAAAAEYRDQLA